MTLEEINAARITATLEVLNDGGAIDKANELLAIIRPLDAVGESAGHCVNTLTHFIMQAGAFIAANTDAPTPVNDKQVPTQPVDPE